MPILATDQDAGRLMLGLMSAVAPSLSPDPDQLGYLFWTLERERQSRGFPTYAPSHDMVAAWLGLSRETLIAEVAEVLQPLETREDVSIRAVLYQAPHATLDALARNIDRRHAPALDRTIAHLVDGIPIEARNLFRQLSSSAL